MRLLARAAGGMAILGAVVSTPLLAQRVNVQPGKWTIDNGDIRCTLARRLGGAQSPVFILSSFLGRDNPEVMLMRDGTEEIPDLPGRVEVVLAPTNVVRRGVVRTRNLQGGRVRTIEDLGEGFIERFGEAQSVRIQAGGRVIATLDIPSAAMAVGALKSCNDDLLRSWDVDTTARDTWQRLPRLLSGDITSNDYPRAAVANEQSGTVVIRLTVRTDGRAGNCNPVVRSGTPVLDEASCRIAAERFRFEPALNAAGQPINAIYVQTIRWILPS